jgi:hypothetical protein
MNLKPTPLHPRRRDTKERPPSKTYPWDKLVNPGDWFMVPILPGYSKQSHSIRVCARAKGLRVSVVLAEDDKTDVFLNRKVYLVELIEKISKGK